MHEQLDRIEEKLDTLLEHLTRPAEELVGDLNKLLDTVFRKDSELDFGE